MKTPKNIQGPVTLRDIAIRAGVSSVTTGRVLLGSGQGSVRVGKKTAERIRRIAAELDYRPNLTARQLAGVSSKLIGAIIDSFATDTGRSMLMTIERTLAKHGYRLLVGFMHDDFDRIKGYLDDFRGRGVDGVISMAHTYPEFGERIPPLFKSFKNCVFIERPLVETPFSVVDADNEYTGYMLTRHLLNLGRRRVAVCSIAHRYPIICDREAGYQRAYREMGIPADPALIYRGGLPYIQSLEAANECLDPILETRPDAIIASSDEVAIWFIQALHDRGIRVPEDCGVASLTYMQACRGFRPTITTATMEYEQMALKAVEFLLKGLKAGPEHPMEKESFCFSPKLIVGQSCGSGLTNAQ